MNVTITINTDNAAFDDNAAEEVNRIISDFIVRNGCLSAMYEVEESLLDYNGNKVGEAVITKS